jgi:hypothetical protein
MDNQINFLWLDGVFEEDTVRDFRSISPAVNFWHQGFLKKLQELGVKISIACYPAEQAWPFGRFFILKRHAKLLVNFSGSVVGYINIPIIREIIQYFQLKQLAIKEVEHSSKIPLYLVIFSCLGPGERVTPVIRVARYIRQRFGIQWVCIVGDGITPPGADFYVHLAWSSFISAPEHEKSIHLDGGVPEVSFNMESLQLGKVSFTSKAFMYMGALTEHGGVTDLALAFISLEKHIDAELWICGRGRNDELQKIAKKDHRIKIKGYLEPDELDALAKMAYAFVNPRPSFFAPNQINFPSKILHYLAYNKPIISTFTEGLSPEYEKVLIFTKDGSSEALTSEIKKAFDLALSEYSNICNKVIEFNKKYTWDYQAQKFLTWLNNCQ